MANGISWGTLQAPSKWAWRGACWVVRRMAGTEPLAESVGELKRNVYAMADALHVVVASTSHEWSPEQRERVQRLMTNFPRLESGLGAIRPTGNPVTQTELDRLKAYVQRAKTGGTFLPQEATEFKEVAERVAHDHAKEEWVQDLLQLSHFLYSVYVVAELLKTDK